MKELKDIWKSGFHSEQLDRIERLLKWLVICTANQAIIGLAEQTGIDVGTKKFPDISDILEEK